MSFRAICERCFAVDNAKLPDFNEDALAQTLKALADEETSALNEAAIEANIRISRAGTTRVVALTVALVVLGVAAMFVPPLVEEKSYPILNQVSEIVGRHFIGIIMTMVTLLGVIWATTSLDWRTKIPYGRDLLELSNVRRTKFITIYAIAAIIVALGSITLPTLARQDFLTWSGSLWTVILHRP